MSVEGNSNLKTPHIVYSCTKHDIDTQTPEESESCESSGSLQEAQEEDPSDSFLTIFEEMDDDVFHRMMSVGDWTYSPLFSDDVFENRDWHRYQDVENCEILGDHSRCSLDPCLWTSIQSATEPGKDQDDLMSCTDSEASSCTGHTDCDESDSNSLYEVTSDEEETDYESAQEDDDEVAYFSADEHFGHDQPSVIPDYSIDQIDHLACAFVGQTPPTPERHSSVLVEPMNAEGEKLNGCLMEDWEDVIHDLEPADGKVNPLEPEFHYTYDLGRMRSNDTISYLDCALAADEFDSEAKIWSILTDRIEYPNSQAFGCSIIGNPNKYCNDESKIKQQFSDVDTRPLYGETLCAASTPDAKTVHYNADNCNKPNKDETTSQYAENRYENVNILMTDTYDPNRCIGSTYLWSEKAPYLSLCTKAFNEQGQELWFEEGKFPINIHGETEGHLLDGSKVKVLTLLDSGCSKPILNKRFYDKHKFLHSYPRFPIKTVGVKVANDSIVPVTEAVCFLINFHGHVFEYVAYLANITQDYDFIVGQKSMYEQEGGANFRDLNFHFMKRSLPVKSSQNAQVKPGKTKTLKFYLGTKRGNLPPDFGEVDGSNVIIKMKLEKDLVPQTFECRVHKDSVYIKIINNSKDMITIDKHQMVGCVDLRSVGYFHIARDTLARILDHGKFLSEEETEEYFRILKEDHKEILNYATTEFNKRQEIQKNTRLKERKEKIPENDCNIVPDKEKDPYPWLDPGDPRRKMSDREILEEFVDLTDSKVSAKRRRAIVKALMKYRVGFSLRDEIGTSPTMEVELELNDTSPFFIRPFPIKESDKDIIDREMKKGCLLGILRKGMSSYSSPIMLIPRKQGGIPRIVTDFRHLNTRLVTLQPSIPLVRDAIQVIGASGCEVLSLIDLRDAYHTLRLTKKSQKYCGITPYHGSDTYLYQRLGMGLSVSPAIWQNFIQKVLQEIPNYRKHHLAIMDDCLVFSKEEDHLKHLIDLFKAIIRNGLKISPKKCKLFKTELVYMGHQIMIRDGIPMITPMKSRVEAILKLEPPKTPKGCKQFCGMVNFLSMFLEKLQEKLIPIYKLTKKGTKFEWGQEQQEAFDQIKKDLSTYPVLAMPASTGHFVLVSDTSKKACGGALYQNQKGQYRLIGYYSKKLPEAVTRYSISELELTGIVANVSAFKYLLKNTNFTIYCDHSALVHILKAKKEPPTLRLMKLIEHLSDYKCTLNFLKGKEMHVTDFLSRHANDDESPHEIIPIAFLLSEMHDHGITKSLDSWLKEKLDTTDYCRICKYVEHPTIAKPKMDVLNVVTRSMTKAAKAEVTPMYPLRGDHKKPEKSEQSKKGIIDLTKPKQDAVVQPVKPAPPPDIVELPTIEEEVPQVRPHVTHAPHTGNVNRPIRHKPLPMEQVHRKVQRPPVKRFDSDQILAPIPIDVELKGKLSPFDVQTSFGVDKTLELEPDYSEVYQPLFTDIPDNTIMRRHIPKQHELNKFIDSLKRKIIKEYNIPITMNELKAEYKNSPHFKDIVKYINNGYCRYVGHAQKTFKMECENYVILNGILFRIRYDAEDKGKPSLVLCIPEKYITTILYQYHTPILAGHPGIVKMFENIRRKYYFPGMLNIIRQYVISCFNCESAKDKVNQPKQYFARTSLDGRPMGRFSMDIKYMPDSKLGFKHILVCTCEHTNWVEAIPIINQLARTIADALYFKLFCKFGNPKAIIMDEGPAFTSHLFKTYLHALNIKPIYISPMNHGSNRTERYIRTLSDIICKNLTNEGENWPMFVQPACWAMNTQVSHVTGFTPYEMVYHTAPPDLFNFDFDPNITGITVDTKLYMQLMQQRRKVINALIAERKKYEAESRLVREIRRHPDKNGFAIGDLVYIHHQLSSELTLKSKKFTRPWIGPCRIQDIIDETHYLLTDWSGHFLPKRFHVNRLKPYVINTGNLNDRGDIDLISNTKQLYRKWQELAEDEIIKFNTKETQTSQ